VQFLIVLVVLALAVVLISAPLRRVRSGDERDHDDAAANKRTELEAAREAKYREIRDAELDHRTGKLSEGDYLAIDQTLRAEAIEILRALDRLHER
jgi:hypothetical protein